MKYLLMMQFPLEDWKTSRLDLWPPEDIKTHMAFLNRFNQELIDAITDMRTLAFRVAPTVHAPQLRNILIEPHCSWVVASTHS